MKTSGQLLGRFISVCFVSFHLLLGSVPVIAVELLSVRHPASALPTGGNGDSVLPLLCPEGRFVVFSSTAGDLVTNDNAWLGVDVFRHDRVANTTVLVSENVQQNGGGDGHSIAVGVSTNGRYVLFESTASDLVGGDTNLLSDVFVRDCQTRTTHLVSVAMNGGVGVGMASSPVMTPDGRYVAFVSYATNLVANDTNNSPDVFVRDLQLQTTTLVSVGATNANASIGAPVLTPDGRWVAFFSTARGLVAGVSNISRGEIYLRDLTTSTTYWPSTNAIALVRAAMQFTSVPVPMHPVLSDDGRFVAFACGWTNNAGTPPGGTTPATVLFQYDAIAGTTTVIYTNGYPPSLWSDEVFGPEMTPDGRFVVFAARVTNGVSPFCALRFWDRLAGTNGGVSVDVNGVLVTNRASIGPVLSADGRYVSFSSDATNLVSNPVSHDFHFYRRDLVAGITELVDADLGGVGSTAALFDERQSMSADGRFIAYSAPDGNLVLTDDNGHDDVFTWDAMAGTNGLISRRETGLVPQTGNSTTMSGLVFLSGDGNRVAYASYASDLIEDDTNENADIFVWNRMGQSNQLVSVGTDGLPARGGMSVYPKISADGRYVLFVSGATNLVGNDTNGLFDVFLRDLDLQLTSCVSLMTNGTSLGSHEVQMIAMTPDARHVILLSRTNATGATYPLFWRDLSSGNTKQVASSVSYAREISLSTNGQRVAYCSSAGNLLVWDAVAGSTIYSTVVVGSAMISPGGNRVLYQASNQLNCYDLNGQSNLNSWPATLGIKSLAPWSPDERHVVLVTASALVASDTNGVADVYLCDLQTGTRSLISANDNGSASGSAASDAPLFSADGRFIAYRSMATNLLAAPTAAPGLFVFDRVTGSNQLRVAQSSVPGMTWISWPSLSTNGDTIAFRTLDAGLVPGDLNRNPDAFAGSVMVLSTADGDADGIPDWWLQQYFGHPDGQIGDLSRAGDDADGDGLSNTAEFLAGTDPTDDASVLEIQITLTPPTGTNAVLSWPAQAGKNYRVQFSDAITSGDWQNLSTPVQVLGGQGWVNVTRTNLARVFRVRCEP